MQLKYVIILLKKNLPIDYDKLSSNSSSLGSIGTELFSLIVSKLGPEFKEKINDLLHSAIKKSNKNLVKRLLQEIPNDDEILLSIISLNDIEFVNMVFDYNSKPCFVNRIGPNGTALAIACNNNNLEIIKRLLFIPGINPSLYSSTEKTPLIIAITTLNLEMMNLICDFYGENIEKQKWQFEKALNFLFAEKTDTTIDENETVILNRILDFKFIHPNHFFGTNTFLTYACSHGKVELVEHLLKCPNIDVNLYETSNGNTPLMLALKSLNFDLVKLLINHPETNINQKNYRGYSPLMVSVKYENEELINILINDKRFDPEESLLNYSFFISTGNASKKLVSLGSLDVNLSDLNKKKLYVDDASEMPYIVHNKDANVSVLIDTIYNNDIDKNDLIIIHPSFYQGKSFLDFY